MEDAPQMASATEEPTDDTDLSPVRIRFLAAVTLLQVTLFIDDSAEQPPAPEARPAEQPIASAPNGEVDQLSQSMQVAATTTTVATGEEVARLRGQLSDLHRQMHHTARPAAPPVALGDWPHAASFCTTSRPRCRSRVPHASGSLLPIGRRRRREFECTCSPSVASALQRGSHASPRPSSPASHPALRRAELRVRPAARPFTVSTAWQSISPTRVPVPCVGKSPLLAHSGSPVRLHISSPDYVQGAGHRRPQGQPATCERCIGAASRSGFSSIASTAPTTPRRQSRCQRKATPWCRIQ